MPDTSPAPPADETLQQEIADTLINATCGHKGGDYYDACPNCLSAAVLPIIARVRAADRAEIAAKMEAMVTWYPEDVFPPDSWSPDAVGARAMRHAYGLAAQIVRGEYEPSAALAGEPEED